MVRITNAVAARARSKKLLKRCKGFYGDRKNHLKLSKDALMTALANNYKHRKLRKRDFRSLWIMRIGVAAKINGMSYSRLINGLKRKAARSTASGSPNSQSAILRHLPRSQLRRNKDLTS